MQGYKVIKLVIWFIFSILATAMVLGRLLESVADGSIIDIKYIINYLVIEAGAYAILSIPQVICWIKDEVVFEVEWFFEHTLSDIKEDIEDKIYDIQIKRHALEENKLFGEKLDKS